MKVVWMLLSLIIALVIIYLIWEEFIAKKDSSAENEWEREFEADIKALGDEAKLSSHPDTAAAALIAAAESAADTTSDAAAAVVDTAEESVDTAVEEVVDAGEAAAEAVTDAADNVVDTVTEEVSEAAEAVADTTEETTRGADDAIDALAAAVATPDPDDLTKIKGIGKVYQGRLNEAGIYTYEQIVETPAAQLKEIANAIEAANVGDWARQSRELIAKRDS